MAQAKLSPKQYIQTKARSLPINKCFVNKDWEEGKMAQVIVMRRHVNGNLTVGVYLIDLLCLGVKDTMFIFNEPEAAVTERFGDDFNRVFEQIDYNLAHNIVYAGHDFAMDFEIKPHPDFAITKFMLEEDNDDIPLLEVEVGQEGKPHLMVAQAGQYSDALARLKKIAGEGNYYYTIGGEPEEDDEDDEDDDEFDFDEDDDDEDDEEDSEADEDDDTAYYDMDEYDLGEITPLQAQVIYPDDLLNEERVGQRAANEVLTIQTEIALRELKEVNPFYFVHTDKEEDPDQELFENEGYASGVTEEQEEDVISMQAELIKYYSEPNTEGLSASEKDSYLLEIVKSHADNPLIVANIFENVVFSQEKHLAEAAKVYLQRLSPTYPSATLTLALAALINGEDGVPYEFIYKSESLSAAFEDVEDLGEFEINTYGLLQTLVKLNEGNLRLAIYYYYLAADTEVFSWLLPAVQDALTTAVVKVLEEMPLDEDTEEEDTDDDNDDNRPGLHAV